MSFTQIDSQENLIEDFRDTFFLLTKKQKKIWRYLQYLQNKFRQVNVSHARIAEKCDCHRDTVIEAIKKFTNLGWLGTIKRMYKTSLYFLNDQLAKLDTTNSKTFHKISDDSTQNPTQNPTLVKRVLSSRKNDIDNEYAKHVQKLDLPKKDIPAMNKMIEANPKAFEKAMRDLISLEKKEPIKNPAALLTARFAHHNKMTQSDEVKHLDIPEKDKAILNTYNNKCRNSFMLAFEDFKTYSVVKNVSNIAAFLTSRFKAHLYGELDKPKTKPSKDEIMEKVENAADHRKKRAQQILTKHKPEGWRIFSESLDIKTKINGRETFQSIRFVDPLIENILQKYE